ncbi:MAG: plastocyanin/azurin family copper-binding protein [Gemmatimonadota bacterium]|nr:plastocyanin/azurin family copper-binding protein [Gemmatimonadota bacterium]
MASYLRSYLFVALALVASAAVTACGDDDPMDPDPPGPTTGTLNVTVNADGAAQSGVTVNLYASGGATPTSVGVTGGNGMATFSNLDPGTWDVEVELPDGFELDTGEQARKSATVVAGETASASFALVDTFDGELIMAQDNLTFSQASLTITAGTAVRWVNSGVMLHTVTPDGHSEWSAATLGGNGDMFTHTFNTAGTYAYYCEPHQGQGMTGTITVQP